MDIYYFVPHLVGVGLGLISGLIPGVGNFVLMLLIWPFLSVFGIAELLIMYASMAAISQYIGSILLLYMAFLAKVVVILQLQKVAISPQSHK